MRLFGWPAAIASRLALSQVWGLLAALTVHHRHRPAERKSWRHTRPAVSIARRRRSSPLSVKIVSIR